MIRKAKTNISTARPAKQRIFERVAVNEVKINFSLFLIFLSVNVFCAFPTMYAAGLPVVTNSKFTLNGSFSLSNISGSEILPQTTTIYTGNNTYSINFDAPTSIDLNQTDPAPLTVSRTISPIWTWTFNTSAFSSSNKPTYTTTYTITNFTNGKSTVPVTFSKTTVSPTKSSNTWTLKEILTLYFDFSNASLTGTYTGSINVNVTATNFTY
jgi:hypothetical protein